MHICIIKLCRLHQFSRLWIGSLSYWHCTTAIVSILVFHSCKIFPTIFVVSIVTCLKFIAIIEWIVEGFDAVTCSVNPQSRHHLDKALIPTSMVPTERPTHRWDQLFGPYRDQRTGEINCLILTETSAQERSTVWSLQRPMHRWDQLCGSYTDQCTGEINCMVLTETNAQVRSTVWSLYRPMHTWDQLYGVYRDQYLGQIAGESNNVWYCRILMWDDVQWVLKDTLEWWCGVSIEGYTWVMICSEYCRILTSDDV